MPHAPDADKTTAEDAKPATTTEVALRFWQLEAARLRAALRRIANDRPKAPREFAEHRLARVRKIAREAANV